MKGDDDSSAAATFGGRYTECCAPPPLHIHLFLEGRMFINVPGEDAISW